MEKNNKPLLLKKVREEKGYTLRELASELGVNYSVISYWEYGKKKPRTNNQLKLEKTLGVPFEELSKEWEEQDE